MLKKLGILQPYFFPYLGYFDLINRTDEWIIFDTCQYIRHGWVNRNRILHPNKGWQYITVPVQQHQSTASICNVQLMPYVEWRDRIVRQMEHYKKHAPYYERVIGMVELLLDTAADNLGDLNGGILRYLCACLGIEFNVYDFSRMDMELGAVEGSGDWALRICEARGATEYHNPPGGEHLFNREKFEAAGIELHIQKFRPLEYMTPGYEFQENLSILDVLMWNSPEAVKAYLDNLEEPNDD